MRFVFLALAVWGTVHPMWYFISWFQAEGVSLSLMVNAWHANSASTGLVWDLTVAACALTVWIVSDVLRNGKYWHLVAVVATFGIGVSCGLPLYLYFRSAPKA